MISWFSLYHLMAGVGCPITRHSNRIFCPSMHSRSLRSCVNLGGTTSEVTLAVEMSLTSLRAVENNTHRRINTNIQKIKKFTYGCRTSSYFCPPHILFCGKQAKGANFVLFTYMGTDTGTGPLIGEIPWIVLYRKFTLHRDKRQICVHKRLLYLFWDRGPVYVNVPLPEGTIKPEIDFSLAHPL